MTSSLSADAQPPRSRVLIVSAIVILGFAAYANTFHGEFVWDDASSILLHENVQDPSRFFDLFAEDQHAFAGGQGNFYRPLVSATFMFDYALSRPESSSAALNSSSTAEPGTFFFHLSSVSWHILAAVFLFLLMSALGAPRLVCSVVPLVYVIHPLHTEAVAYLSGRADSMSAAFMFAGLWWSTRDGSRKAYFVSTFATILCFAGALLSKESALIFPVLLLMTLLVRHAAQDVENRLPLGLRLLPAIASLAVLGGYIYLRTTVLNFGSDTQPPDTSIATRMIETLQAFALYLKLVFLPTGLHMERTLLHTPTWVAGPGAAMLLIIVGAIGYALKAAHYRFALAASWFLVTWLPISGLFPLNAPMAEHWLYVPMAGGLWAVAEVLWSEKRSALLRGAAVIACVLWSMTLLAWTVERNEDWHDNESLYLATLDENPDSRRVRYNLAVTYEDLLDNPYGARRHYERMLADFEEYKSTASVEAGTYWDEELESHHSLGTLYFDAKQYSEGLDHFEILLNIRPNSKNRLLIASAAFQTGQYFLTIVGNRAQAESLFRRAVELEPRLLSNVRAMMGSDFSV